MNSESGMLRSIFKCQDFLFQSVQSSLNQVTRALVSTLHSSFLIAGSLKTRATELTPTDFPLEGEAAQIKESVPAREAPQFKIG